MNSSLLALSGVFKNRPALCTVPLVLGSIIFFLFYAPVSVHADALQKTYLEDASSPRFTLTGRVWPSSHGDADVCTWNDDKLCAVSVTIDDNWTSDHPFWKGMTEKYGYYFTWFVMVDGVSFWAIWQKMFNAGYDIQGHDYCSINSLTSAEYDSTLARTRDILNRMVKGNHATTYAYPCGVANITEARRSFISCRGTVGGFNPADRIVYHKTKVSPLSAANLATAVANRHWMVSLYHGVSGVQNDIDSALSYAKRHDVDIWMGPYSQAARYAQERDTHTLTVDEVRDTLIRFTVTDSMSDSLFDYPLCVKVRVNGDWEYAAAVQDTMVMDADIVEYGGNKYALVDAVPDRGAVTLTKAAAPVVSVSPVLPVNAHPAASADGRLYTVTGQPAGVRTPAGVYLRVDAGGVHRVLVTR